MAIYAPLHKTFWTDPDIVGKTPTAKLLFLYLFSGPDVTPSGMYNLSIRKMAFETEIPEAEIRNILLSGQLKNISYDEKTSWVFVHKKLIYSPGGRKEYIRNGINTQVKLSPHNPLWKKFHELYPDILTDVPSSSTTVGQQLDNSCEIDKNPIENNTISTVEQQLDNSSATVREQLDNSSATDEQLFNTNTNTMFSVVNKTTPIPDPFQETGKGIKNPVIKKSRNRGKRFQEFFDRYPGKKLNPIICKAKFMEQIQTDADHEEFLGVFEKYLSAHKARKISDMKRIRWLTAHEYLDGGWRKIGEPDWALGKKPLIRIVKSQDSIREEKQFWLEEAIQALGAKNKNKIISVQEDILEFQGENPGMPKVLTFELQRQIDNFLTQQEA